MSGPATIRMERGTRLTCKVELPSLHLRVTKGPNEGRRLTLALPLVRIGSAPDNDLVLEDPAVSRYHAEVLVEGDALVLRDAGSTNGTRIGAVRISRAFLEPGQRALLGDSEILVEPRVDSRSSFVGQEAALGELVGASPPMRELYGIIRAVAPTHVTVLLTGESGTGKELVARALHELSGRKGPLVAFDAASTDPEMVRSDLFGHRKGAFTGADSDRDGAFRKAHGGTLFLDEIGELPLDLQSRLLRVLETREVTPLGSDQAHKIDVRVVAATHRDLEAMAADGRFRLDLYHRLAVVPVGIPALRERPGDVPLILERMVAKAGTGIGFGPDAKATLAAHSWPGNVRELRNLVDRLGALHPGKIIGPELLKLRTDGPAAAAPSPPTPPPAAAPGASAADMASLEKKAILAAMEKSKGNKTAAAQALGISLSTLQRRLRDYGAG